MFPDEFGGDGIGNVSSIEEDPNAFALSFVVSFEIASLYTLPEY